MAAGLSLLLLENTAPLLLLLPLLLCSLAPLSFFPASVVCGPAAPVVKAAAALAAAAALRGEGGHWDRTCAVRASQPRQHTATASAPGRSNGLPPNERPTIAAQLKLLLLLRQDINRRAGRAEPPAAAHT